MKEHIKYIVFTGVVLLLIPVTSLPINLNSTGDWSLTISETDLQSGAGSDLNSNYSSASNVTLISVSSTTSTWEIQVSKTDVNWYGNLQLYVRRTGTGTYDTDPPTGGTSYQEITGTNTYFWEAADGVQDVPLQFRLTGVSITVPPDVYQTTVTFTVVETI